MLVRIVGMTILRTAVAEVTREVVRDCFRYGKSKVFKNKKIGDAIDDGLVMFIEGE